MFLEAREMSDVCPAFCGAYTAEGQLPAGFPRDQAPLNTRLVQLKEVTDVASQKGQKPAFIGPALRGALSSHN
jgi:hypothetical protein